MLKRLYTKIFLRRRQQHVRKKRMAADVLLPASLCSNVTEVSLMLVVGSHCSRWQYETVIAAM